jgi:uncharacterized protein CbrC (UPF0167 family)
MDFPTFRYHPDPIATGSVVVSDTTCVCCGQARGFIYMGPVTADEELDEALCPWCIADGSAARRFDAEFTERAAVGDYGQWDPVPDAVRDEPIALENDGGFPQNELNKIEVGAESSGRTAEGMA